MVKVCAALHGTSSQGYTGCQLSHWITLPVTQHKWTHPALNPARPLLLYFYEPDNLVLNLPTQKGQKAELT